MNSDPEEGQDWVNADGCPHECHDAGLALCVDCAVHHPASPVPEGAMEQVEFTVNGDS